jgi:hypothetical protein
MLVNNIFAGFYFYYTLHNCLCVCVHIYLSTHQILSLLLFSNLFLKIECSFSKLPFAFWSLYSLHTKKLTDAFFFLCFVSHLDEWCHFTCLYSSTDGSFHRLIVAARLIFNTGSITFSQTWCPHIDKQNL